MKTVSVPNYTDPIRQTTVFNDDTEPVAPFGLMRVTDIRSDGILVIKKPNESGQTTLLVNGPMPIVSKDYGQGSFSFPAVVAIDQAGKNPESGDILGTTSGSWNLQRGSQGFQVMAAQNADTVNRVLADRFFGTSVGVDTFDGWYSDAGVVSNNQRVNVAYVSTTWNSGTAPHTTVATSYPEINETGYWYISFTVSGRISCNVLSGQTPEAALLGVVIQGSTNCEFESPIDQSAGYTHFGAVVASAVSTDASGNYVGEGTCTVSGIVRVFATPAQIAITMYGYIKSLGDLNTTGPFIDIESFGSLETIAPTSFLPSTTYMIAKIGEL